MDFNMKLSPATAINNGIHLDQMITSLLRKAPKFDFVPKINTVLDTFSEEPSNGTVHELLIFLFLSKHRNVSKKDCNSMDLKNTKFMEMGIANLLLFQVRKQY
jgi:hypothetical protein